MKRILLFIALTSVLSPCLLFGQAPVPATPPEEKKDTSFQGLLTDTLDLDIDTAGYYELIAWCAALKLPDSGDKQALQQRLRDYYKVAAPEKEPDATRKIEIESAQSSEYFTIDEVDEEYILIRGNVNVVLTDKKDNTEHSIRAERILYNQKKNIISASGNIVYTRKKGETTEVFKGESFIFDVGSWEGVLYVAQGEQVKKVEDSTLTFVYTGSAISRMKDDTIIIENGVITSSPDISNPNYRITASRIWVFGPGEWAIRDAVLHVGHIPVLYFPFYYYSTDEIFFNPVVGFRDKPGAFLQNTLYLIGRKTRDENPLSFLPVDSSSQTGNTLVLDGLFLRPIGEPTAAAANQGDLAATIKHLKLYADIYSRLGAFTGVSFDMSPAVKINSGIAVSRNIYYGINGYTSYYLGEDHWHSSNFFGTQIPLRYGFEGDFSFSLGLVEKITGHLNYYSDPYFTSDFYSREETQDWGSIIGFDLPASPTTTTTVSTSQLNLNWTLTAKFNFATLINSPLLKPFEISTFGFAFDWGSRTISTVDPVALADPSRTFYYPQRIVFPNLTFQAGGTLLSLSAGNEVKVNAQQTQKDDPGSGPLLPGSMDEERKKEQEAQEPSILERPDIKGNLAITRQMKYYNLTVSYILNQTGRMEHLFDHESWATVQDITYDTKYSNVDISGTSSINYRLSLWNSTWDLTGSFIIQDKYKTTIYPDTGVTPTATDLLYTSFDLSKSIIVTYNPFLSMADFKNSSVSYNLKWDYFDIYYNTTNGVYVSRLFAWQRETMQTQEVKSNLVYQPEDKPNSLKTSFSIPPVLGRVYGELNFYLWIFQTIAILEYKELSTGPWRFEPFRLTEKASQENLFSFQSSFRYDMENRTPLDLENDLQLFAYKHREANKYFFNQELDYDYANGLFSKSRSSLELWDFSMVFLAQKMLPVNSIGKQTGVTTLAFVPYTLTSAYRFDSGKWSFWNNRIIWSNLVEASLTLNFQKYIDSNFTLRFQSGLKIHEFLDLVFKIDVYNNNIYRYIPPFVDTVNADVLDEYGIVAGITAIDPITDLLRSLNFFNIDDRYNSFFKLKAIGVEFVHHLQDWTLKIGYSGEFKLQILTSGSITYEWIPTFSFSLKWLPIPEIKREFTGDKEGLNL